MSGAVRAVGSLEAGVRPLKPENGDIYTALGEVYNVAADAADGVKNLAAVVGKPEDGDGQPATGIFAHMAKQDRRITKFERLWERGVGFGAAAVLIGGPCLTLVWWLAGDRLAALFGVG